MNQSEQIHELAKALVQFQNRLEGVEKSSTNPYFKSKYADLHTVWQAIRLPLTENGLCVTQTVHRLDGRDCLVTTLLHISGQWIRSEMPIILSKNDIQSFGGALTYCKRYALQAIVGCSSYDDDGEENMKEVRKPVSDIPLVRELGKLSNELAKALLEFDKADIEEYVSYLAIQKSKLPADIMQSILDDEIVLSSFKAKLKDRVDRKKLPI